VAKSARLVPDFLTPLGTAGSLEAGLTQTLKRLVSLSGASAGALVFRPPRASVPVLSIVGPASQARALRALLMDGAPAPRGVLRASLGVPGRSVGEVALVGRRPLRRSALPAGFARDLGATLEPAWEFHRRALRLRVLDDLTRLLVSSDSLDDVLRVFAEGLAKLVSFDSVAVSLVDAERDEFEVIDVAVRGVPGIVPRDGRLPVAKTLMAEVIAAGAPLRVDDLADAAVPEASRAALGARGWRSAALVPLRAATGSSARSASWPRAARRSTSATSRAPPSWRGRWPPRSNSGAWSTRAGAAPRSCRRSTPRASSSRRGWTSPPCSIASRGR